MFIRNERAFCAFHTVVRQLPQKSLLLKTTSLSTDVNITSIISLSRKNIALQHQIPTDASNKKTDQI